MAGVEVDVSHAAISRALASLGERAGGAEVAVALRHEWEPFEAQMRRRMRCRPREHRSAYLCLARAGAEKVRFHLEATGVLPPGDGPKPRRPGVLIRVRDGRRRPRRVRGTGQGLGAGERPMAGEQTGSSVRRRLGRCEGGK